MSVGIEGGGGVCTLNEESIRCCEFYFNYLGFNQGEIREGMTSFTTFFTAQDGDRTMPAGYPELAPAFAHDLRVVPLHD